MTSSPLIEKISQLTELSKGAWERLEKKIIREKHPRGEELLGFNKVCQNLYHITSGALRGYYHLEGKEVTSWIGLEGEFCADFLSFITRKPSYHIIECTEPTEVECIRYDVLMQLYQEFPETEKAGRLILEQYYTRLEERMIQLQFRSARERYELLFETRPELFRRAALGHIASYLGMTQETLSRIRGEA